MKNIYLLYIQNNIIFIIKKHKNINSIASCIKQDKSKNHHINSYIQEQVSLGLKKLFCINQKAIVAKCLVDLFSSRENCLEFFNTSLINVKLIMEISILIILQVMSCFKTDDGFKPLIQSFQVCQHLFQSFSQLLQPVCRQVK